MSEKARFAAALAALFILCVAVAAASFYAAWAGSRIPSEQALRAR